jgi:lysophospholipase L1-like esterase
MKNKFAAGILVSVALVIFASGCAKDEKSMVILREGETEAVIETATEIETKSEAEKTEEAEIKTEVNAEIGSSDEINKLTAKEIEERKNKQAELEAERAKIYELDNSKDKTDQINQLDREILANNTYDFSKKNILFMGDSITAGIYDATDADGNMLNYTRYVDAYLHFNRLLNHAKEGTLFTDYGGNDLSLDINFDNVVNVDSHIIVVFAGANDYLTTYDGKYFGDITNKTSTGGYCGAVRSFMSKLKNILGDRDIFFVTMYDIDETVNAKFEDITTQPTLNDYMDVQRTLAKEYGFNIIELQNIGFMDGRDSETAKSYMRDRLHPNEEGNIILGEHIAAELSLYFSQK